MKKTEYFYLTLLSADKVSKHFSLSATMPNCIGRGNDCGVSLQDGRCSRVHATIEYKNDVWLITDANSSNGTFVNGQRVKAAELHDGTRIRVGASELRFEIADQPATTESNLGWTQTIVQDALVAKKNIQIPAEKPNAEQIQEMRLLYELTLRLLGCQTSEEVVHAALELLHYRTSASIVGFLWQNDDGLLVPKLVFPPNADDQTVLSPSLTEMVMKQGRAVWVANQAASEEPGDAARYADAVCVPLVDQHHQADDGKPQSKTVGAIHVYLQDGRFRQSDFEFTISVANIVTVALVKANRVSVLQNDYNRLVADHPANQEMIGESKPMLELKEMIGRIAKASGAVLIRGESGTGKELVARAIHSASQRAERPMVSVNCAAIPADLIESQLFGHAKGAFTGADNDHSGYFQQADMGTLFLDEIGELSLTGQAKLLRVLEGHPFTPVGASEEVSVDVRVLAATNQDLQKYVRDKKFREDLFYRLNVFKVEIPPLRERGKDIDLLANAFLAHFRAQHGRGNLELSETARELLLQYGWPGNVRQLRNVLDSAVVLAEGKTIEVHDLALRDVGEEELQSLKIEDWEKKLIHEALKRTSGNVPAAAKLLGLGRATLYRRLEEYDIAR